MNIIIYLINQFKNKNCFKKSFKFHIFILIFAYLKKTNNRIPWILIYVIMLDVLYDDNFNNRKHKVGENI